MRTFSSRLLDVLNYLLVSSLQIFVISGFSLSQTSLCNEAVCPQDEIEIVSLFRENYSMQIMIVCEICEVYCAFYDVN